MRVSGLLRQGSRPASCRSASAQLLVIRGIPVEMAEQQVQAVLVVESLARKVIHFRRAHKDDCGLPEVDLRIRGENVVDHPPHVLSQLSPGAGAPLHQCV
mmetsp:Transcript_13420/g.20215  ORF Transcript_13420/g.20215 Transcript_13420/m.20215 type:complete len:100 (-) Transcript_13420:99-398(-)